jgi:hypothetical protein
LLRRWLIGTLKNLNTQHKKALYLIENLCRNPKDLSKRRLYGREIKLAKELLKSQPDFDFWVCMRMDEKPYSLSWFKTEEGKLFLSLVDTKNNRVFEGPKEVELSTEKIGEDKIIKKTSLNLKDFLRKDYGKDKGK